MLSLTLYNDPRGQIPESKPEPREGLFWEGPCWWCSWRCCPPRGRWRRRRGPRSGPGTPRSRSPPCPSRPWPTWSGGQGCPISPAIPQWSETFSLENFVGIMMGEKTRLINSRWYHNISKVCLFDLVHKEDNWEVLLMNKIKLTDFNRKYLRSQKEWCEVQVQYKAV